MKQQTVCFLGGHLSPALATAQVFRERYKQARMIFIGRSQAFGKENEKESTEGKVFSSYADHVYVLSMARLSLLSPLNLFHIVKSIYQCIYIFRHDHPDVVVSFGGYVAFPACIAAWIMRIPIVIHEQTHTFGLANRIISWIAHTVCVSYPDMKNKEYVLTGLPLRKEITHPRETLSFSLPSRLPILFVTGGTTGAVSLNNKMFSMIPTLIRTHRIVHQTGQVSFEQATEIKKHLSIEEQKRYIILPYVSPRDASWLLKHASCVISRAGANTVYELGMFGTPAILVPLPWAKGREQEINAEWLKEYHDQIYILSQDTMTNQQVFNILEKVTDEPKKKSQMKSQLIKNGSHLLVDEIVHIMT